MTDTPDEVVFGPQPDPLLALLTELRAALEAVFGPPRGLMQIIPPDPDALARLAARTPEPDPQATARYMAARLGATIGADALADALYVRAHGNDDLDTGHTRDPAGDESAHG